MISAFRKVAGFLDITFSLPETACHDDFVPPFLPGVLEVILEQIQVIPRKFK